MKIEGYEIIGELRSEPSGLKIYEAIDQKGDMVQIRLGDYIGNINDQIIDNWYEVYELYQSSITNYKYLPRVLSISILDSQHPYTVLKCEKGKLLEESGSLTVMQLTELIDAISHLHRKKFIHGSISAKNIWITNDGHIVLFGAGETRVWKNPDEINEQSDIIQVVKVIREYALLNEKFINRLIEQHPNSIMELADALSEAEQHIAEKPQRKKAGLIEKEEPKKAVVPEPVPIGNASKEKEPRPQPASAGTGGQENEARSKPATADKQKRGDESNPEPSPTRQSRNRKPRFRKILIGLAALMVIFFAFKLFSDMGESQVNSPDAVSENENKEEKIKPAATEPQETKQPEVTYTEPEIIIFMKEYTAASVNAINQRDFSLVESMIDPNGDSYKEQRDYIKYLESKGITENLQDFQVKEIEKTSDQTFKVSTYESYKILYGDGSVKIKDFNSAYTIKILVDGELAVNRLLFTNEISSEDIVKVPEVTYTEAEIINFTKEYLMRSVDAINQNDFSLVESMVNPDGEAYKEQRDYIKYLDSKGITEQLLNIQVKEVNKNSDQTYKVSTSESYKISYGDGSEKIKDFNSAYMLKVLEDGDLTVNRLLFTNEIFSEDVNGSYQVDESKEDESTETVENNYDFTIDNTSELKEIIENAMMNGQLGPFNISILDKDLEYLKNEFGEPDDMDYAQCTECDSSDSAYYGDYGINLWPSRLDVWLQTGLVRSEIEELIGQPSRKVDGMYQYEVYDNGNYSIGVLYQDWASGYGEIHFFEESQ